MTRRRAQLASRRAAFPESMQIDDVTEQFGEPRRIIAIRCHGTRIWHSRRSLWHSHREYNLYTRKRGDLCRPGGHVITSRMITREEVLSFSGEEEEKEEKKVMLHSFTRAHRSSQDRWQIPAIVFHRYLFRLLALYDRFVIFADALSRSHGKALHSSHRENFLGISSLPHSPSRLFLLS